MMIKEMKKIFLKIQNVRISKNLKHKKALISINLNSI